MPPGPNSDQSEVIANYLYNMMIAHKVALGVADVWYGDQDILPRTPALCVAPGNKKREFQGASFRTLNTLETYIMVYYGKIQDIQANTHAATALADSVEPYIHADQTLGGNSFSVLCTQSEPGVINKGGVWVMGTRITVTAQSKTTLPQQVV